MRLLRHLSFSNVIAMLALFLALGGAAYAGAKVDGKDIVNGSIGGGKLKKQTITANKIAKATITAAQIKPGSIGSSSIDLATLGTVPSAQSATTAATATKADTAKRADAAQHAASAQRAESANTAARADLAAHAESADTATHAASATAADSAAQAGHATTAGEAETLNGETAGELTVACPSGTEFYGGMCWDETTRAPRPWLVAVRECGVAGGRLPTIDELIAFVLQPGEQVEGQTWSGEVESLEPGPKKEVVFTTDELGRSTAVSVQLGYRCVFPQSN